MLDINITAIIQVVNFFIAITVLNMLLIRPIREMLKLRKGTMDDMLASAEQFAASADTELASYQAALAKARQEAMLTRANARAAALDEQHALLGEVGKETQEQLAQAKSTISQEVQSAQAALARQIKPLATRAVGRMLA